MVILWSPGLCRNIPALSCVNPGLCKNMPAEPEPFDLCACSCMSDLVGYLKPDYFQKSPRRLRQFEEFQSFVECKPHKVLKACQTRWFSLETCVNRLIEQYGALLSYLCTEDKQAVVKRLKIVIEKPLTKAYLLFLCSALPIVNNINRYM